jgi:eukaryotic-like serine/threonine-protein kinase
VVFGRYELHREIASGGMAKVHVGCQMGAVGFSRLVAIKRLHAQFADTPEFVAMFLDEARLAARVRHPNVVTTLDVVHEGEELFLVMEYVEGASLSGLVKALRASGERIPVPLVSSIMSGVLHGLHAAHRATGPDGAPLGIVHRDVSPQNVLVGTDGVARVVDFGIALANVRLQTTREGQFKGKLAYTSPEQFTREERVTAASDIYSAGLVLWELCAGRRAFQAASEAALLAKVLAATLPRIDEIAPWVSPELAEVTHRAIEREPDARYATARDMALALERAVPPAPAHEVGAFVERAASESLQTRRQLIAEIESRTSGDPGEASVRSGILDRSRVAGPVGGGAPAPRPSEPETRSTHTISTDPTRVLPQRAWALRAGALLAFTAVVVAVAFGARWLQQPDGALDAAAMRAAAPGTEAANVASHAAPTPAPTAPQREATPTPAASETAPPATSAARPRSSAATRAAPAAKGRAQPPASKDSCDPPYSTDANGIRRVKRACFGR